MKKQIILILAATTLCNLSAVMTKNGPRTGGVKMGPGPVMPSKNLMGGDTDRIQALIQQYMPGVKEAAANIGKNTDVSGLMHALNALRSGAIGMPYLGDLAPVYKAVQAGRQAIAGLGAQGQSAAEEFVTKAIEQIQQATGSSTMMEVSKPAPVKTSGGKVRRTLYNSKRLVIK